VLKPVESYHWRTGDNWEKVGGRKAFAVWSREELAAEYAGTARADKRVLVQEMIAGEDDCLVSAACYFDQNSSLTGAFTTQKLAQGPERFGTGFVVQAVERPEVVELTVRLLKELRFTGIAEVEYKWNSAAKEFQLIEINPRPWDQHRIGAACGMDLMHIAYCEHAGLRIPPSNFTASAKKWIAEDSFVMVALGLAWRGEGKKLRSLFRLIRGDRLYAVWSRRDPLPFLRYLFGSFIPGLTKRVVRAMWSKISGRSGRKAGKENQRIDVCHLEKGGNHG
jgi:predicted ATP-grasp superfamily ATP-dependent carboligase